MPGLPSTYLWAQEPLRHLHSLINLDLYTVQNSSNIKEKYFLRQALKEFLPVEVSLRNAKNKFFDGKKNDIDNKLRPIFILILH